MYDGIEKAGVLLANKIDALQERVEDLEELETRIEELEDDDEEDADLAQWKGEEAMRRKYTTKLKNGGTSDDTS